MELYHVLHEKYQEGQPIYCLDEALREGVIEEGDLAEWVQDDLEGYVDFFNVCFFDNLDDAKQWAKESEQSKIAKINDDFITMYGEPEENEEGYLAMEVGSISPEFIEEVIVIG